MNTSGIIPLEFNVVIKQDDISETTPGGLMLPEDMRDRDKHAQVKGVIVALSSLAFNADIFPADQARPQPGDKVYFAKHSGTFAKGTDGEEYRIVKDKDIVALIADDDAPKLSDLTPFEGGEYDWRELDPLKEIM